MKVDVNRDLGFFVQDKWTTGRWTLAGALRLDSFKNSFPEQSIVGTIFGRDINIQYDKIDNLSWNDVTPSLGATYDVFGNGKTALKVTLNKYLEGLGTTGFGPAQVSDAPNPINRLLNTTQRVWADVDRDFVPDCNLNNFACQRRVSRARQRRDLRHGDTGHELRPGPDDGLGEAVLQLGVHDERPAGDRSAHVGRSAVRPTVVRQHSRHG